MNKYAVIDLNGVQFKVSVGDQFLVDHTEQFTDPRVLLVVDGDKRKIGNPEVKDAKVELKIIEQTKEKKIEVSKFKAKSRYRKNLGFRASKTKVEVKNIS